MNAPSTASPASDLLRPCFAGFVQFDVREAEPEANLARVEAGLAELAPRTPGLVALPELWATGFAYEHLAELGRRTPELLGALTTLARRHNVLLAGSLIETVACPHGTTYHNTLYLSGPDGVIGSFRKQHLFAPMGETDHFRPGTLPAPLATPLGRLAPLVCFDLRFPELAREMAGRGAGLLLVSAQWPLARLDHWQTLLRARAIENQLFVVAANRCGTTGATAFAGNSMLVGPDGTVLARADAQETAMGQWLDPGELGRVRGRFNTVAARPYPFADRDKVADLPCLQEIVRRHKAVGRRVVFTNGCFDILHPGHVTYLEAARQRGDCLIVGLNSDASIRAIKGPDRPVNREEDRARLLAALGCVDHVVLFEEETPINLITALLPDVLIKGGDWPVEKIVGGREVVAAGGTVTTIELVDGHSTTGLIARIRGGGGN